MAGQKGGAKGAMRGRGKGGKSRGGGSRSRGGTDDMGGYGDNFGGGYGGKDRPCVGLCYLRSEQKFIESHKIDAYVLAN